ncbi:hypothetical protein P170DRAFT_369407 [Aspergillus steynii IBT 23096]|uniref:Pre-mRNA splicing factor CLF1 n=1 Tax=Aspergillus steynii IBT 23096 TaxID=1392250 RepID=A0A2I2FT89_9EURO|nr:uncharacterized protein P170DRAFT_369407 [Aspergillus steynii IBT 23096]PLB43868.1 hypothetical protein P170DRAFT_369407 [Aspergillus steynii IBT 23096]
MIVPKPPVKLEGHCSVVHDNTLYTYSANGFAAIPLERNGTWSKLDMGEPVSNAACVTGGIDGDESQQALYVVGGTPSKSKGKGPGVQRYSFKDKKWKSFEPSQENMANRTDHNAVYLKESKSILVYGGHQKHQTDASSDTFVVNTADPYNISAFEASKASPVFYPVLLSWNDKEAALVGGLTDKTQVYLFDPAKGWRSSDVTIGKELSDDARCALVKGTDGSKILETFDMGSSPNTMTSETLLKSGGKVASSKSKSSRRKRVTLDDYPKYDDSLASSTKRDDFSIAQGDNQVVFSSGSGSDTLAIFNQTSNSWVNATKLFYGDKPRQSILPTTSSTSTTTSGPTSTASETSPATTTPAAGSAVDNSNLGTVLGATLGSILGVAAVLLLIIFLIKRKKNALKREAQGQNGDKDRLSFQDRGVEPLTQSAYPMAKSPAPLAASSVDSLAIFGGSAGDEKASGAIGPGRGNAPKPSPLKPSPLSMQSDGEATAVGTPASASMDKAIEAHAMSPGDRRTDEGWSRYFQDNTATDLAVEQAPPRPAFAQSGDRASQWPGPSLTPLNMGLLEEPKPLGRVVTGSPTTEHTSSPKDGRYINIPESQSARISSASSISAVSDDEWERRDGLSAGMGESNLHQQSWMGRPPSSTYSRSMYNPSMYNPSSRDLPSMPPPSLHDSRMPDGRTTRGSSILIPDTYEPMPQNSHNNINSDMSWLNLHAPR